MIYRHIFITFLATLILQSQEMKCEAGKCGASMQKKLPKTFMEEPLEKQSKPKQTKQPTVEQLFNVKTVKVKAMEMSKKQINYGYLVADESRTVEVTAWFSGYVETLHVKTLYQKVKKGQLLASVYSPEVYKAKQDYLNALKYNHNKSASMSRSARTKLRLLGVSKIEINTLINNKKATKVTSIYAPISGWIFKKNIFEGSYISDKKSLFTIVNLSTLWLEAKLFQNELFLFNDLKDFQVHIKGVNKVFKAKKELLYPSIDTKEATATLRLSLDNNEGLLKPGMYAKLHTSIDSGKKIIIPRTAAIRKSGKWYAFLATDFKGEYEPVEIELEPLTNQYYSIIKGLSTKDTVVNNALFMMDSDAQINSIY